jgi:hypothetical protein
MHVTRTFRAPSSVCAATKGGQAWSLSRGPRSPSGAAEWEAFSASRLSRCSLRRSAGRIIGDRLRTRSSEGGPWRRSARFSSRSGRFDREALVHLGLVARGGPPRRRLKPRLRLLSHVLAEPRAACHPGAVVADRALSGGRSSAGKLASPARHPRGRRSPRLARRRALPTRAGCPIAAKWARPFAIHLHPSNINSYARQGVSPTRCGSRRAHPRSSSAPARPPLCARLVSSRRRGV